MVDDTKQHLLGPGDQELYAAVECTDQPQEKVDPDVTKIYITLIVITWEEGFKNSTAILEYVTY